MNKNNPYKNLNKRIASIIFHCCFSRRMSQMVKWYQRVWANVMFKILIIEKEDIDTENTNHKKTISSWEDNATAVVFMWEYLTFLFRYVESTDFWNWTWFLKTLRFFNYLKIKAILIDWILTVKHTKRSFRSELKFSGRKTKTRNCAC